MYKVYLNEFDLRNRADRVRVFFEHAGVRVLFERYVIPFVYARHDDVIHLHNELHTDWFATAVELAMDEKCLPGIEITRDGTSVWTWAIGSMREPWLLPQGWTPEPAPAESISAIHVYGANHVVDMSIGSWNQIYTRQGRVYEATHSIQAQMGPNLLLKDLRITAFAHENTDSLRLISAEGCRLDLENVRVLAPEGSAHLCFPAGDDVHLVSCRFLSP